MRQRTYLALGVFSVATIGFAVFFSANPRFNQNLERANGEIRFNGFIPPGQFTQQERQLFENLEVDIRTATSGSGTIH
jgi:hypothetical protein